MAVEDFKKCKICGSGSENIRIKIVERLSRGDVCVVYCGTCGEFEAFRDYTSGLRLTEFAIESWNNSENQGG